MVSIYIFEEVIIGYVGVGSVGIEVGICFFKVFLLEEKVDY